MRVFYTLGLLTLSVLATGCDTRPKLESDATPFSVGGIKLGMKVAELAKSNELLGCSPEGPTTAKCYVRDSEVKYRFLGVPVDHFSVLLHTPTATITQLKISVKGKSVTVGDLQKAWKIDGRCLSRSDVEAAIKMDAASSGYFARSLRELDILPMGYEDVACLADDDSLFKYIQYVDGRSGSAEMYYLQEVFANNFRHLLKSKVASEAVTAQVAQITATKPSRASSATRCPGYNADGANHEKFLVDLATKSGHRGGVPDRMFTAFVSALCAGELQGAQDIVEAAQIPVTEARFLATHFGIAVEFEKPAAYVKDVEETRSRLTEIGLCQACAISVAVFTIQNPDSECAKLVGKAIAGDEAAKIAIEEQPATCESKN